jgi:purine-nucleoside phosphorylase
MTSDRSTQPDLDSALTAAVTAIRTRSAIIPRVAVILGSGLGAFATAITDATAIPYTEIPGFARPTVPGHAGRLILGTVHTCPVGVMQGRFHFYEGYDLKQVVFPVRVLWALGASILVVTNAAGGLNPAFRVGDFMLLRDHINLPGLAGHNPLFGPNDDRLGPRFPTIAGAYDLALRQRALALAAEQGTRLHEGIYVMVAGPSFETAAELAMLRQWGADAVGMSTIPEVIAARHMGMRVLGISCITNIASPTHAPTTSHEEVLAATAAAAPHLTRLLRALLAELIDS